MSEQKTPAPKREVRQPRAVWRIGRGRSGGSLGLALFARWAIEASRTVRVADGDPNNPMLSRVYPPDGAYGVARPTSADPEAGKLWLATTLAEALEANASVVIDMGGGDRVGEELASESDVSVFLQESGMRPTYVYFTGPESDDFDHVFRIWNSQAFKGGDSILVLNEGLARTPSRGANPFAWLENDPRFPKMLGSGMRPVNMPALTCMKYFEEDKLTVFDALDGKKRPDGTPVNPLWLHMAKKWASDFKRRIEEIGAAEWLP